ncbi:unnamed protein product [Lupinus luteus]|uniref:Flowering time control protein FCA n=1 Tax=Lupinus luteus TaxID=3873 RepID=A0AAV1WP15_LUPLU
MNNNNHHHHHHHQHPHPFNHGSGCNNNNNNNVFPIPNPYYDHHHQQQQQHVNHFNNNHSMPPRPFRKRGWHQGDQVDGCSHVKVYVAPVPRTSTEADVRLVFEVHGTIIEVVLLKDKSTGARQGSCLVKYATLDEADRAIKALNNQYTFPGEATPVVVRYADRERERLGVQRNLEMKGRLKEVMVHKVYVGHINKEASKKDFEDIFSPYGHVEEVFIPYLRGYAFVKYSSREMASAAIEGLNGKFTMRGCDTPLIVRFADPIKPKTGESRDKYLPGNANFGPSSQEPAAWPQPNFGNSNIGRSIPPTGPHHPPIPHPQVTSQMQNWERGAAVVQHPFPFQQVHSQMVSMPLQPIQAPNVSSQPFSTEVQRQSHLVDSTAQNMEQKLNSQLHTQTGSNSDKVVDSIQPIVPINFPDEVFPDCDWSEHYCPDGHKYYYNCVTCESRWEKPEENVLCEKESQKPQGQEDHSGLRSQLASSSPQQVAQSHQDINNDLKQTETSNVEQVKEE